MVSTTPPAIAGSILSFRIIIGIVTPASAAQTKFAIIAAAIIPPILKSLNQAITTSATIRAHAMPFKNPTASSFANSNFELLLPTCPNARPRMTKVNV